MTDLLTVSHLKKSYGELLAVDDVSFQVRAGEIFGLLGPNGAGKSTTMMMLAGLLEPDSGTVSLNGEPFHGHRREVRKLLGVVPQDLAIYPELTATENLKFFGSLYGLDKATLNARIEWVLHQVGLTSRASDKVEEYSGGMKRRLNFAAALLHRPKLLILDEPTVGVDPQSRSHLLQCVQDLSREGMAVIYASHYMEEVNEICERVAIMDHGKVLVCDAIPTLLARLTSYVCLTLDPLSPEDRTELQKKLGSLAKVEHHEDEEQVKLEHKGGMAELLPQVLRVLKDSPSSIRQVHTHEPDLEHLFLDLTGRSLRD